MTSPRQSNIPELDGVRGVACISIVLLHCLVGIADIPQNSFIVPIRDHLMPFIIGGVDLFFVLSGFLIGGILLDNRGAGNFFKAFYVRRIARIFPVNYALLASFVVFNIFCHTFDITRFDAWLLQDPMPVWYYATFTQSIPMAISGTGGPLFLGITWSLAIEEQFYVLFPLVVYFCSRRFIVCFAIAAVVVSPLLFTYIEWTTGRHYTAYVLLPCRMYGLFLGVLVACLIRNPGAFALSRRIRLLLDGVILLIVYSIVAKWLHTLSWELREEHKFLSILTNAPLQYSITSLMFALLILRVFLYEGGLFRYFLRSKFLGGAGLISYALYMYHQAVSGFFHGLILNQVPRVASVLDLVVAIAVIATAVGLATLSYFYLERPIRRLGHRVGFNHTFPREIGRPESALQWDGARLANIDQPEPNRK